MTIIVFVIVIQTLKANVPSNKSTSQLRYNISPFATCQKVAVLTTYHKAEGYIK